MNQKVHLSRISQKDESLLRGVYGRGVESNFIGVEFKEEDGLIKFKRSDQEDV